MMDEATGQRVASLCGCAGITILFLAIDGEELRAGLSLPPPLPRLSESAAMSLPASGTVCLPVCLCSAVSVRLSLALARTHCLSVVVRF